MERCKILWLSICLILPQASAQSVPDHTRQYIEDQMLENVIIVDGVRADGSPLSGKGMIIGREGDLLWVATAGHVIYPKDQLLSAQTVAPVRSLVGKLRSGTTWPMAMPPEQTTGGEDLAFFALRVPRQAAGPDMWRESVEILAPKVGTQVRIAALKDQFGYGVRGARIAASDGKGNVEFSALTGAEGQSGAPIATSDGFIGIYVRSEGKRMVPMSAIRQAALTSNRPYQLIPTKPEPRAVRLCLVNADGGAFVPPLTGLDNKIYPDKQGCFSTMSGMNLLAPAFGTDCEPREFTLTEEANQTLRFTCSIDPGGVWRSARDGLISVTKTGDKIWKVEGLPGSQFGQLGGILRGTPPMLQMELRTPLGFTLQGMVDLQAQKLQGKLAGSAGTYSMELSR